jgi:hypothetical protein
LKPVVFIQNNASQTIGARIAEYCLRKHSQHPERFDVRVITVEDYPQLLARQGQMYLRKGAEVVVPPDDLQSFSPLRFLPPQLMGFAGRAIVIDPDVFALADINELLERPLDGKAICTRYVTRPDGSGFWGTSVMLMDCAKLRHWRWDETMERLFRREFDYGDWVSLKLEDQSTILPLEEEWNSFDKLTSRTKMLHTTERLTQPWKTGLPIEFNRNYRRSSLRALRDTVRGWLRGGEGVYGPGGKYQPHPDPNQETLLLTLIRECLEKGVIDEPFLKREIRSRHVRGDIFEKIRTVGQAAGR